jgi:hypothetical protein
MAISWACGIDLGLNGPSNQETNRRALRAFEPGL